MPSSHSHLLANTQKSGRRYYNIWIYNYNRKIFFSGHVFQITIEHAEVISYIGCTYIQLKCNDRAVCSVVNHTIGLLSERRSLSKSRNPWSSTSCPLISCSLATLTAAVLRTYGSSSYHKKDNRLPGHFNKIHRMQLLTRFPTTNRYICFYWLSMSGNFNKEACSFPSYLSGNFNEEVF